MSQMRLDDDELFSEAASDVRANVEEALGTARAALPTAADVWTVDAENTLGVLNALKATVAADEAAGHFREAKKWYTIGERAGAFDADEGLAGELAAVESVLDRLEATEEHVMRLTTALPDLRAELDAAREADGGE